MKKGTKRKTSDEQQSFKAGRPGKKRAKKTLLYAKYVGLQIQNLEKVTSTGFSVNYVTSGVT